MSMDYKILKSFNDTTSLVNIGNDIRVVKLITPADVPIFKKLMKIKNENLAQIYDVIENEEKFYVICEYVPGETAEEYVNRVGKADAETVARVAKALCSGLDSLHKNNIVHRDISAKNVIIGNGCIKLIDFSISRTYKNNKCRDTMILGTQGYAAPEQFGFSQSSPRSDIYSVGVLMNYMLTGKFPFEERYNGELSPVISKCIEVDEMKRYSSVNQLKSALNKNKLMYGIYAVPGFRSNKLYKKMIAVIYYAFAVFMCFAVGYDEQLNFLGFKNAVCWFAVGLFVLIIPVFLLFNYCNWSDRLFKNSSRQNKLIIRIFAVLLCFVIAYMIPTPM